MKFSVDPLPEENSVAIDLTSLIDVLFVLLLFFMVTTTFAGSDGVVLDLPSASGKATASVAKDFSVSITEKGDLYLHEASPDGVVNNQFKKSDSPSPLTLEEFSNRLQQLKGQGADITLVVQADKKVQHGKVVEVLDKTRSAGIEKIAIATVQLPTAQLPTVKSATTPSEVR